MLDPKAPLPPDFSQEDAPRLLKRIFQSATSSFYRDDWKQVEFDAGRLKELCSRWKKFATDQKSAANLVQGISVLEQSANALEESAKKHDVVRTTLELKRIAQLSGTFERSP